MAHNELWVVTHIHERGEPLAMHYRPLGTTGLSVSALGLGCSHLGTHWRGRTRSDMVRLLEHAIERGITFFDTADVYMQGESEELLGSVLRSGRHQLVIATKAGFRRTVNESAITRMRPYVWAATRRIPALARAVTKTRRLIMRQDFSAGHLTTAVEASLRRLKTDRLELLQLHSPPASAFERDGALETLERLRAAGKIRFYGLSFGAWDEAALRPSQSGVATVQLPISPRGPMDIERVLGSAGERRIGVIANQPLMKGTLLQQSVSRVGAQRGAGRGRSLAQVAIRCVSDLPGVTTVLTGTTSVAHLDENAGALEGAPLDEEELAWLCGENTRSAAQPRTTL